MKRSDWLGRVKVFPPSGSKTVIVDNLKFAVWSRSHGRAARLALLVRATAPGLAGALSVPESARPRLERVHNDRVFCWDEGDDTLRQFLGVGGTSSGSVALTLDTNPLRAVRRLLIEEGPLVDRLAANVPDNVVDPGLVPPEVVHRRIVDLVPRVTENYRARYPDILWRLFGVRPVLEDVCASVNVLELAWDRSCRFAPFATRVFWDSWRTEIAEANLMTGRGLSGGEVLKGKSHKGCSYKLYAKTPHVLRFEVQLSGKRIRALLGRGIDLLNRRQFGRDLGELAELLYPKILGVQDALDARAVPSIVDAAAASLPVRQAADLEHLLGSLLADGTVRRVPGNKAQYSMLVRLRERGLVRVGPGKGVWTATAALNSSLGLVSYVARILAERRAR